MPLKYHTVLEESNKHIILRLRHQTIQFIPHLYNTKIVDTAVSTHTYSRTSTKYPNYI